MAVAAKELGQVAVARVVEQAQRGVVAGAAPLAGLVHKTKPLVAAHGAQVEGGDIEVQLGEAERAEVVIEEQGYGLAAKPLAHMGLRERDAEAGAALLRVDLAQRDAADQAAGAVDYSPDIALAAPATPNHVVVADHTGDVPERAEGLAVARPQLVAQGVAPLPGAQGNALAVDRPQADFLVHTYSLGRR